MTLTGKRRYRSGWFGRVILQVEEGGICSLPGGPYPAYQTRWRDATALDLAPQSLEPTIVAVVQQVLRREARTRALSA